MRFKAFSIAEAMITLVIVSVALAAMAPMMTKKQTSGTTIVSQFIGAIMFFEGNCPSGWTDLSNNYAGRYVRIAGKYDVCDKQGENSDGSCVSVSETREVDTRTFQGEALRKISGRFPGNDSDVTESVTNYWDIYSRNQNYVNKLKELKVLAGVFDYLTIDDAKSSKEFPLPANWEGIKFANLPAGIFMYNNATRMFQKDGDYITYTDPGLLSSVLEGRYSNFYITTFDTGKVVPTDIETRPKTVVLRACKYEG